jgi:hypothetical protein
VHCSGEHETGAGVGAQYLPGHLRPGLIVERFTWAVERRYAVMMEVAKGNDRSTDRTIRGAIGRRPHRRPLPPPFAGERDWQPGSGCIAMPRRKYQTILPRL